LPVSNDDRWPVPQQYWNIIGFSVGWRVAATDHHLRQMPLGKIKKEGRSAMLCGPKCIGGFTNLFLLETSR